MTLEPVISDFMTLQPQSIEGACTVQDARRTMSRFGIRHLPVTADGVVVGLLSERDIHLVLCTESADPAQMLVNDVCSERPYIVSPDAALREVVGVMAREHLGSAIAMENAKLVGIFTTADACRALHDLLEKALEAANLEKIRNLRFLLSQRS